MGPGYDGSLFILAFDHRGSFKSKMFGIVAETDEDRSRLQAAKRLVWQGFLAAADTGLPDGAGILVDEEMGAAVAREAKERGVILSMPVEKSGQDVFDFEYGDDFPAHLEAFSPDFAKVLVRWNPDDAADTRQVQGERLARLGRWLASTDRRFLFELLVPASARQLAAVEGDQGRYDAEVRPGLMLEAIADIRERGVEPDVWKIEGIDDQDDCRRVAELITADGRDRVKAVVLGRGADDQRVEHWLRTGAPVPGYAGFAIGRSIWWDAVAAWRDAKASEAEAAETIASQYLRFISVYRQD